MATVGRTSRRRKNLFFFSGKKSVVGLIKKKKKERQVREGEEEEDDYILCVSFVFFENIVSRRRGPENHQPGGTNPPHEMIHNFKTKQEEEGEEGEMSRLLRLLLLEDVLRPDEFPHQVAPPSETAGAESLDSSG